uniref:Uncharacterized protein MANES_17G116600 n=2 Tax=Rhizophora mucronata TaxID=61149 RepID=A0A2P2LJ91_RHIMU
MITSIAALSISPTPATVSCGMFFSHLQDLPGCGGAPDLRAISFSSFSHCRDLCLLHGLSNNRMMFRFSNGMLRINAMSPSNETTPFRMNLNEYMVTLEKPLGIRFASSPDGRVFVHALKKEGNAERSRIIMVGDTLKKASDSQDGRLLSIKDFSDTEKILKEKSGSYSLVFERPFSPFPIHHFHLLSDLDVLFNRGRVPVATWNKSILASNLKPSSDKVTSTKHSSSCEPTCLYLL